MRRNAFLLFAFLLLLGGGTPLFASAQEARLSDDSGAADMYFSTTLATSSLSGASAQVVTPIPATTSAPRGVLENFLSWFSRLF